WFSAWRWWQSRSQKWRNACEFSRFPVHPYFAGHLCGSAAHSQESDGILGYARYAQLLFRVARRHRRCSNDGFLFPDSRTATALRSELSLSFPRIERDLYHDSRRGGVERKTKRAARHRRDPDHRGNRARFDELNCDATASVVRTWQAIRLPYNDPANNGQSFSRVVKLVARAFSRFGGASFGRSNSPAKPCFQRAYFGGEYAPQMSPLMIGTSSRSFWSAHSRSATVKRPLSQLVTACSMHRQSRSIVT